MDTKEATAFGFQPPAGVCRLRDAVTGMRAIVLSVLMNLDADPSESVLYTCKLVIAADAAVGDVYALPCSLTAGSDPDGNAVALDCEAGAIEVTEVESP